jgi:hypothetical protein
MVNKTGLRWDSTTVRYTTIYSGGYDINNVYQPATNSEVVVTNAYSLPYSRVGGDTPKWRSRVRSGGDCSNSYAMQDMRLSKESMSAEAKFWVNPFFKPLGTTTYRISGDLYVGTPTLPGAFSAQAHNQALNILVGRANGSLRSLQGGTVLGEIHDTLHQILRPAQGFRHLLGDYLNDVRKGRRFRRRKDKRRYVRDLWLEYRLGFLPLLSDTQGAAEALARIIHGTHPLHPISSTGRDYAEAASSSGGMLTNGPLRVLIASRVADNWYAKGWAGLRESAGGEVSTILGVGFDQFIPTIYELIPYSFVLDYFSNVGQVLNTRFFDTGKFQYWGLSSRSQRIMRAWTYGDATVKTDPSYISSSVSPGETVLTITQFNRVPSPPLTPSVNFYLPRFPAQVANVAALLDGFRKITPL